MAAKAALDPKHASYELYLRTVTCQASLNHIKSPGQ